MSRSLEPTPEVRAPLSRDRVLYAALALADTGGIEALSMRRLGQQLGVEAMSLYNHVSNKDDLRDGIVDVVLHEIEEPAAGPDWKSALRHTAMSSHDTFVRHRWACVEMLRRPTVRPVRLRWMEAVLGTLRAAGFSAALTHHAFHAVESHITGFTLWQVSMPFATQEELAVLAESALSDIPVDRYPYVVEHARQHMAPSTGDGRSEFEFGLDLVLDDLQRLREAE
ncbi:MAG: TetR/AcrR family transcriptional regulator C-terminal domain-containing protein [Geodermatophilaceae bacterium]|nr:TetR/AcrR family transcriptional regulator C-terminal domain-containing protein [Geodermatophilaceae bacterium]